MEGGGTLTTRGSDGNDSTLTLKDVSQNRGGEKSVQGDGSAVEGKKPYSWC